MHIIKMDKVTAICSNHDDYLRNEAPSSITFFKSSAADISQKVFLSPSSTFLFIFSNKCIKDMLFYKVI